VEILFIQRQLFTKALERTIDIPSNRSIIAVVLISDGQPAAIVRVRRMPDV
jgi:hypothetical protein